MQRKRVTVHVFKAGDLIVALSVHRFLRHHGVDAVIVTKHAVQIHPDHVQKAQEVCPLWRWGWDRKEQPPPTPFEGATE